MVFLAINTKAILGATLLALTVAGGCVSRLAGKDQPTMGAITGQVVAEDAMLQLMDTSGWQVLVQVQVQGQMQGPHGIVTPAGTYAIADVPPGTYSVQLVPPARPGEQPTCTIPGCRYDNVTVLAGMSTMNVDFRVSYIPVPPF